MNKPAGRFAQNHERNYLLIYAEGAGSSMNLFPKVRYFYSDDSVKAAMSDARRVGKLLKDAIIAQPAR